MKDIWSVGRRQWEPWSNRWKWIVQCLLFAAHWEMLRKPCPKNLSLSEGDFQALLSPVVARRLLREEMAQRAQVKQKYLRKYQFIWNFTFIYIKPVKTNLSYIVVFNSPTDAKSKLKPNRQVKKKKDAGSKLNQDFPRRF